MSKMSKSLTGVFILVFVMFVVLLIFSVYSLKILKSDLTLNDSKVKNPIAVIEVKGVIKGSKSVIQLLLKAEKDKKSKAIIVRIDSPGGVVGPTQEIYDEMLRIDNLYNSSKGTKGKPVYASMGAVAASGGYYLAAAARSIYANPGTLTGSLGVIMKFYDISKLYEMAKIKPNTIKAGLYKDIGSESRSMTLQEKKIMEKMINGVRNQFVTAIMKTRKNKIKGDIEQIAQGQIFSGEEALKIGLVDHLKGLWGAGRQIHKELKLKGEFGFKFIKKENKDLVDRLFGKLKNSMEDLKLQAVYNNVFVPMFLP